ncbi:unnamed protein product [Leuciscus chuanchicus]
MYLIVEFEGEGTTGPIAKSWYADGYSWWPPYKDLGRVLKSVRTMEEPQPEKGWTRHRTRILHESASFQNVAKNWKKASYTSDINSEPEIARKRIPKKKTCFDSIYSSDDEAPEPPPLKKRKTADKESVPPAPKPPALPKRTKKKGPVMQTEVFQSKAVNPLSNLFVNQQQRETEEQQQTWGESLPSFQAPVCVSEAEHYGDGWSDDPPNTQEHTFSVLRTSGDNQGRTRICSSCRIRLFTCNTVHNTNAIASRAILETLEKMDMKINHLTSLVQSLVGNRRILPQMQNDEEDDVFPLTSIEDLDRLEQSLVDRGFMQRMVSRLSISGGPTMKKTVWRICFKVFTTNVARELNCHAFVVRRALVRRWSHASVVRRALVRRWSHASVVRRALVRRWSHASVVRRWSHASVVRRAVVRRWSHMLVSRVCGAAYPFCHVKVHDCRLRYVIRGTIHSS